MLVSYSRSKAHRRAARAGLCAPLNTSERFPERLHKIGIAAQKLERAAIASLIFRGRALTGCCNKTPKRKHRSRNSDSDAPGRARRHALPRSSPAPHEESNSARGDGAHRNKTGVRRRGSRRET